VVARFGLGSSVRQLPHFVYDGLNPVQEQSDGMVTANLLTGLGIDEFFTRTDAVGTSALLPDALGTNRLHCDHFCDQTRQEWKGKDGKG